MQYSIKLKKAMAEIKDILDKYDIAGCVVIHTPGHTEYALKLDPSYSCAKLERGQLRFKTKGMNVAPAAKRKLLEDSANMMHGLSMTSGKLSMNLLDGSEKINQIAGAIHTVYGHTSQDELDN